MGGPHNVHVDVYAAIVADEEVAQRIAPLLGSLQAVVDAQERGVLGLDERSSLVAVPQLQPDKIMLVYWTWGHSHCGSPRHVKPIQAITPMLLQTERRARARIEETGGCGVDKNERTLYSHVGCNDSHVLRAASSSCGMVLLAGVVCVVPSR